MTPKSIFENSNAKQETVGSFTFADAMYLVGVKIVEATYVESDFAEAV